MKASARLHSRTVADGFCFLLQHAAMNSGVLSPWGPERASFSVCLERERWTTREACTRVCVSCHCAPVCSNEPAAPWETESLFLLVISALTAGGAVSRTRLAGLSAASSAAHWTVSGAAGRTRWHLWSQRWWYLCSASPRPIRSHPDAWMFFRFDRLIIIIEFLWFVDIWKTA